MRNSPRCFCGLCPMYVTTRVCSRLVGSKRSGSDFPEPAEGPSKRPHERNLSLGLCLVGLGLVFSCLSTEIQGRRGCEWASKWRYWVGKVGSKGLLLHAYFAEEPSRLFGGRLWTRFSSAKGSSIWPRLSVSHTPGLWFSRTGVGLRMCISSKWPGEMDAAGMGTTLEHRGFRHTSECLAHKDTNPLNFAISLPREGWGNGKCIRLIWHFPSHSNCFSLVPARTLMPAT